MSKCHDCGCEEGELHQFGCDCETCAHCGGQLITCGCCYRILGVDCRPGTWCYDHWLTDEQADLWFYLLDVKGRIPWVQVPLLCALCGELWPEFFKVPDAEWEKHVIPELQGKILCKPCYERMKALFPNGWRESVQTDIKEKEIESD